MTPLTVKYVEIVVMIVSPEGKIVSNGPVRQTLWDLATTVLEGPGGNTEITLPVSCPCKPD